MDSVIHRIIFQSCFIFFAFLSCFNVNFFCKIVLFLMQKMSFLSENIKIVSIALSGTHVQVTTLRVTVAELEPIYCPVDTYRMPQWNLQLQILVSWG